MFTGIVEKKSKILSSNWWRFKIENTFDPRELSIWQSIAHDWACMTIEKFDEHCLEFFVMEESLKKTNFDTKKSWDFFNVERCLKLWDRLDWHMVSGHIDTTWKVISFENTSDSSKVIKIEFNKNFNKLIIDKWSICVNWVSLTIIACGDNFFTVSLIPLTQSLTNLWNLKIWSIVNLEFDMIWKYVSKLNN